MENDEIISMVVDNETGVVTDTLRVGDSYKKITREQKEFFRSHVHVFGTEDFVMLDSKVNYKLSQEKFTQGETTLLFIILSHLGYNELACQLVMKNGIHATDILTTNDLQRIGNFSTSTLERAIKGLVQKQIIKVDKENGKNVYLVNPFIFYRGKKVPREYYAKFKNTKWYYYAQIKNKERFITKNSKNNEKR